MPSERGRWDTYYPAFAAAVRGEREVPVDPTDAVLALEVIEAAERSAAAGRRRHPLNARRPPRRRAPPTVRRLAAQGRVTGAGPPRGARRRRRSASARRSAVGVEHHVVQAGRPRPGRAASGAGRPPVAAAPGGRGPRRPPSCHACSRAADSAKARTIALGSSSSRASAPSSSRCSAARRRRRATANGEAPSVPSSQTAAVQLGVVRPRPAVEVVRPHRRPDVVDDADLRVDVHRLPGDVLEPVDRHPVPARGPQAAHGTLASDGVGRPGSGGRCGPGSGERRPPAAAGALAQRLGERRSDLAGPEVLVLDVDRAPVPPAVPFRSPARRCAHPRVRTA